MPKVGPFAEPVPPNTVTAMGGVIPRLEIEDIRLVELAAKLGSAVADVEHANLNIDHHVTFKLLSDSTLGAKVRFEFKARGSDEDAAPFATIIATYQLLYSGENLQELPTESIRAFVSVNAVHNAWSYIREIIQSTGARMGVSFKTLPLLKLRPTSSKPAVNEAEATDHSTGEPKD